MVRSFFSLLFFTYLALAVFFVKLGELIPFRTLWLVMCIFLSMFFLRGKDYLSFFKGNVFVYVAVVFSLSGSLATLFNIGSINDVIDFNIKWIIQPVLIFFYVYISCLLIGFERCLKICLFIFCLSFSFAVLQSFEVSFSWEFKYFLDSFQNVGKELKDIEDLQFGNVDGKYDDHARSKGLSWSPVHLSYQACLIFGFLFLGQVSARYSFFKVKYAYPIMILAFYAVLVSGTRSALIGIVLLIFIYFSLFSNRRAAFILVSLFVSFFIFAFLPVLQDLFSLRILQAEDSSASMRIPLYLYGLMLFVNKFWGYGWIDHSTFHAQEYWSYFSGFEGAVSIFHVGLHNYILNVLWVYGLPGILSVWIYVKYMFKSFGFVVVLIFIPYFFNSLFHNGGLFYGGNYIWIFLALIKFYNDYLEESAN